MTQEDNINMGIHPETFAATVTHHSCKGYWSPQRWKHHSLKGAAKQICWLKGHKASPPSLLPFTEQKSKMGPVITAAELLRRPNGISESEWKSNYAEGGRTSISSVVPERAGTSIILPVLRELHRLKSIINTHSRMKDENILHEDSEVPGEAQVVNDMSRSEEGDLQCEISDKECGNLNALAKLVDKAKAYNAEQENAFSDIFCRKAYTNKSSGQGVKMNMEEEQLFSFQSLPESSMEALYEGKKQSDQVVDLQTPGSELQPVSIPRRSHDEDHEPTSPTQHINVGNNPFYHQGFHHLKILEVRDYTYVFADVVRARHKGHCNKIFQIKRVLINKFAFRQTDNTILVNLIGLRGSQQTLADFGSHAL